MPFLDCNNLAVFKAFYKRTRDWADLEDMRDAGTLDIDGVVAVLPATSALTTSGSNGSSAFAEIPSARSTSTTASAVWASSV